MKNFFQILKINLNQVELTFKTQNKVEIFNEAKCDEISRLRKKSYQIPSCTNHLESTHGHMNGLIPRCNAFWPSLHRI